MKMVNNIKYATLLSVAMAYLAILFDSEQWREYSPDARSLFLQFGKFGKRTIVKLTQSEALKAEECFNKIKILDSELFERKGFAPTILILFILIYLRDEMEIHDIKIRFSHFPLLSYIDEIEHTHLREHSYFHSSVFDRYLEVFEDRKEVA